MKEVRVYFECLEQAAHYIKPIFEQTREFKKGLFEIKLIKLTGNFVYYSKYVAPIVYLKDPDILITVVEDGIEYPLLQLEISTAVFTEDHELQRFDGIVASVENNCIYGKLSPINKTSWSTHGGNVNFNHLTSYKAIYECFGKIAFHFDWPCDKNGNVIVDSNYLSCPKERKSLTCFLQHLVSFITVKKINFSKWVDDFENRLLKEKMFSTWLREIKEFELSDIKSLNTSRTEWKKDSQEFHLKINRFGHAMDPERGMLAYYGTIYNNTISKMLFDENNKAWYKDTPKENEIAKYLKLNGLKVAFDYLHCFVLASGLHNNEEFVKVVSSFKNDNAKYIEINLSKFLSENFNSLNKSIRTVFKFSKEFLIIDSSRQTKVKFKWENLEIINDFSKFPDTTPLQNRSQLKEDDITYISIHNILKKNGYKIISVSYPGAQGDRVILTQAGTGRCQQRRYIDIISYLPKKHSALQENKGKFSPTTIQKEISELKKYKTNEKYKSSMEEFFSRFDENATQVFKIGVGFWANQRFTVNHIKQLEIDSLDYFIYIKSDQKNWVVFSTGKSKIFSETEGKVILPKLFEVSKKLDNQISLFSVDS